MDALIKNILIGVTVLLVSTLVFYFFGAKNVPVELSDLDTTNPSQTEIREQLAILADTQREIRVTLNADSKESDIEALIVGFSDSQYIEEISYTSKQEAYDQYIASGNFVRDDLKDLIKQTIEPSLLIVTKSVEYNDKIIDLLKAADINQVILSIEDGRERVGRLVESLENQLE